MCIDCQCQARVEGSIPFTRSKRFPQVKKLAGFFIYFSMVSAFRGDPAGDPGKLAGTDKTELKKGGFVVVLW